jgi:hypothetical protein
LAYLAREISDSEWHSLDEAKRNPGSFSECLPQSMS